MEIMKIKKTGEKVEVHNITYSIDKNKAFATIWRPISNLWQTVKLSTLVPESCYLPTDNNDNCKSKTERNKYKDMLTLYHAVWQTSDGRYFTSYSCNNHRDLDTAIAYEKSLHTKEE